MKLLENKHWWAEYCVEILPTGSRVICDPAPKDTDEDFLLLVDKSVLKPLEERLEKEGFKVGGSNHTTKLRFTLGTIVSDTPGLGVTYSYRDWEETTIRSEENSAWVKYIYRGPSPQKQPLQEWPDFRDPDKTGLFNSWKKGDLNLIVTCSSEYFENFTKATKLATYLNLMTKGDRIALFEGICFDKWPGPKISWKRKKESAPWN